MKLMWETRRPAKKNVFWSRFSDLMHTPHKTDRYITTMMTVDDGWMDAVLMD